MSAMEFLKTFSIVKNKRKKMEKLMELKFLMFENEKNNCWLDASVALIAHNKTFKKIVDCAADSQINKIISTHAKAVSILNDSVGNIEQRIKRTRELLTDIQNSTLLLLKQFLKFKPGEPDSAFCALLNLIFRDKSDIKEHLNVSWIWRKSCTNCGTNSKSATCMKPIITLSKVNNFQPECPTSIYMCRCKTEQEMKLIYKELPSCLIFHFENGAGNGENFPSFFFVNGRKYQLTCIVLLEKSNDPNLNHFVTWIRDPSFNVWLDCNDLNTTIVSFSPKPPELNLKDIYMYVFESFDNLGKVKNEISVDQEQDIESCNVEVIDLSEEEPKSSSENTCFKPGTSKSSKNEKSNSSKIDTPTDATLNTKKEDRLNSSTSGLNAIKSNENDAQKNHVLFPLKLVEGKEQNYESKTHTDDDVIKLKSEITNIFHSKNINTLDSKNIYTTDKDKKGNFFSKMCSNEKDFHCRENNADKSTVNINTSDSKNVNTLDSKNIGTSDKNKKKKIVSKKCSNGKDIYCNENNADRSTANDTLSVIKNELALNDTLSKSSDKKNVITGSSNIFKKMYKEDHSFSENKNWPYSNEKQAVQKNELGSVDKKDKQSTKNRRSLFGSYSVKYSDVENSHSIKQLEKNSAEIACLRKDEQKHIPSSSNLQNITSPKNETNVDDKKLSEQKQKVSAEQSGHKSANINEVSNTGSSSKDSGLIFDDRQTPKTYAESENRKACKYDKNKLQLKVQRTSLKRTDSIDSNKKKKVNINLQNNMVDDVVSKTSESSPEVPKSNKRKNLKKNIEIINQSGELSVDENSRKEVPKSNKRKNLKHDAINQSDKLSIDEDSRNEVPKPNKRKNLKKNEKKTNQTDKLPVDTDNTDENDLPLEERLEQHVNTVVENTFAAFLKQVCNVYQHIS